eukprot:gene6808-6659_t
MSETQQFTPTVSEPVPASVPAAVQPAPVMAVETAVAVEVVPAVTPAAAEPAPASVRFSDFGLSPLIQRALTEQGYEHPTPIQAQAIPVLLQGRDVMGAAQTGTGKTASFSLPIIQMLLAHASHSTSPARHPVRALILTPTRELAVQVAENVQAYAKHTPLRSTVVFGGMDMKPQTIKKLANTFLSNPVTIEVARSNQTADKVTQVVYKVAENQKHALTAHLLRQRELKQVIIFSNTKIGASRLARGLEQEGMKAVAIHGDKSQQERMAALDAFKKGEIDILVATDVAARGLDISDLPCVINYDLPYNAEDYVHRIGRTGRAGASGDALSIYSDKDERLLADIEKLIKQTIKRGDLAGFNPAPVYASEERGERRGRRDEAPRSGSGSSRTGERVAPRTGSSSFAPRREKVDPWFLKPYEPAKAPAPASSATLSTATPATTKPKQKLAFLLGGAHAAPIELVNNGSFESIDGHTTLASGKWNIYNNITGWTGIGNGIE